MIKILLLLSILFLSGCTTTRHQGPTPEQTHFPRPQKPVVLQRERPPAYYDKIMGEGRATAAQMAHYLKNNNPKLSYGRALEFANLYIKESTAEGVNPDVAFAQMCHETRCLQFGNLVQAGQNNFGGIGATGPGSPGHSFPNIQIGIRAQVQHLKAYGSTAALRHAKVDPRFDLVKPRGRAPTIHQLSGTWAADKQYHKGLKRHIIKLLATSAAEGAFAKR